MYNVECFVSPLHGRPPHRGAWIEITALLLIHSSKSVAPRTGGRGLKYDHRAGIAKDAKVAPRTGGRGLKYLRCKLSSVTVQSPPAQGGVD